MTTEQSLGKEPATSLSGQRASQAGERANARTRGKRVVDAVTNRSDWLKQK